MYILKTISMDKIWGDERLKVYGATSAHTGIVYSCAAIEGIDSPVGQTTLRTLIQKTPTAFGLLPKEEYPIIVSFDAAKMDVSVQVHPTDRFAQDQEGKPYGKCEAWYFIEAPKKGWVYAENVEESKDSIKEALAKKDFHQALKKYPVKSEDLLFTPAGTVHCLTSGALIYEIQQSTNITYRLYDYDRTDEKGNKQALHVEKALATMNPMNKEIKQTFHAGRRASFYAFDLMHKHMQDHISNPSDIAAVCTVLSGRILVDNTLVEPGTSILLMPKETVSIDGQADCIMATPNPYWREIE